MRVRLTTFLLLLSSALAGAPADYTYLVEATDCLSAPSTRTQSGFTTEVEDGIVTALHGVVGCRLITARKDAPGSSVFRNLFIYRIDADLDLALLRDSEVRITGGFQVSAPPETGPISALAIGHPSGIPGLHELRVEIPRQPLRRLSDLLPPDIYRPMEGRGSPSVHVTVLGVNGDIQPGHSGAPIVDPEGRVIGVANGGLAGGAVGIAWATLLANARWTTLSPSVESDLARRSPAVVFSYENTRGIPESDVRFLEALLSAQKECTAGNLSKARELYEEASILRPDDPGVPDKLSACEDSISEDREIELALHVSPGVYFKGKKNTAYLAELSLRVDDSYCGRLSNKRGGPDFEHCSVASGLQSYSLSRINLYDRNRQQIYKYSNGSCGGISRFHRDMKSTALYFA